MEWISTLNVAPDCSNSSVIVFAFPVFFCTTLPTMIEVEREADGRWIAEVSSIPGALAYGATHVEAVSHVEALVLRILADGPRECAKGCKTR